MLFISYLFLLDNNEIRRERENRANEVLRKTQEISNMSICLYLNASGCALLCVSVFFYLLVLRNIRTNIRDIREANH